MSGLQPHHVSLWGMGYPLQYYIWLLKGHTHTLMSDQTKTRACSWVLIWKSDVCWKFSLLARCQACLLSELIAEEAENASLLLPFPSFHPFPPPSLQTPEVLPSITFNEFASDLPQWQKQSFCLCLCEWMIQICDRVESDWREGMLVLWESVMFPASLSPRSIFFPLKHLISRRTEVNHSVP